jgi:SAM-dependent methyltransferase
VAASDAVRWARQVRSERPPAALDEYLAGFEAFFDDYAARVDYWRARNPGYHEGIAQTARFHVPRGARVLEIGCGTGDLLASLEPSEGVGASRPASRRAGARRVQPAAGRLERLLRPRFARVHLKGTAILGEGHIRWLGCLRESLIGLRLSNKLFALCVKRG